MAWAGLSVVGLRVIGVSSPSDQPELFRHAVSTLSAYRPRQEVSLSEIKAPQRLAPYSYALGGEIDGQAGELATARLILLHDPDGQEAWGGVLRLVAYLRAEVDQELTSDPLLPEVGWSWLTDALAESGAAFSALGGTVTQTSSARFGDISGPSRTDDLELRASWTPADGDLGSHVAAFCELMAFAVGLPPVGVAMLSQRRSG